MTEYIDSLLDWLLISVATVFAAYVVVWMLIP